jgi:hypothetical protein
MLWVIQAIWRQVIGWLLSREMGRNVNTAKIIKYKSPPSAHKGNKGHYTTALACVAVSFVTTKERSEDSETVARKVLLDLMLTSVQKGPLSDCLGPSLRCHSYSKPASFAASLKSSPRQEIRRRSDRRLPWCVVDMQPASTLTEGRP